MATNFNTSTLQTENAKIDKMRDDAGFTNLSREDQQIFLQRPDVQGGYDKGWYEQGYNQGLSKGLSGLDLGKYAVDYVNNIERGAGGKNNYNSPSRENQPSKTTGGSTGAEGSTGAGGTNREERTTGSVIRDYGATSGDTYNPNTARNQIDNLVGVKKGGSYVDSATDTVAGQMDKLLKSNSPYIQQAEQKAKEQSQGRGLLNSSIASYAGRKAAIESALPIAQQDADTYAGFSSRQQQAENQMETIQGEAIVSGAMKEQQANIERETQRLNNEFTMGLREFDANQQLTLAELQDGYNRGMATLNTLHSQLLQNDTFDQQTRQDVMNSSNTIMRNYQISVENLMSDPDFLNLGPEAMQSSINNLQTLASNSIKFVGAASGIDLSEFADYYLSPMDWTSSGGTTTTTSVAGGLGTDTDSWEADQGSPI